MEKYEEFAKVTDDIYNKYVGIKDTWTDDFEEHLLDVCINLIQQIIEHKNGKENSIDTQTLKTVILGYLGGDIMSHGSYLARKEEVDKVKERNLPIEFYSPVENKSINDKSNMTEEENNHLAEKIVAADIERLWNSDVVVMCPEQHAIGSICETGTLYGWKYLTDQLFDKLTKDIDKGMSSDAVLLDLVCELKRINEKNIYYHYEDIRINHLNEKDWRRSFGINQMLYGMILYTSKHPEGIQSFESILNDLEKEYPVKQEIKDSKDFFQDPVMENYDLDDLQ